MGKIYQHQDKLRCTIPTGIDLTDATTYIIHTSPSGTVGTWAGTIDSPATDGTIHYDMQGTYDIYEYGLWKFYAVVVDTNSKRGPGEPFTERIYQEGTPI